MTGFENFGSKIKSSHRMFLLAGRVMNKLGLYLWCVFSFFHLTCGPGCLEVITSGSHKESFLCCRMYQAQVAFGSDVQIWKQVSWHYWSLIFVVVEKQICSAAELKLKYQIEFWLSQIIFGLHSQLILCLSEQDECHWKVTNSTNKLSIHCLSLS